MVSNSRHKENLCTRKQKMSVYSSMDLLVGLPAPWPDFVSTLIIRG